MKQFYKIFFLLLFLSPALLKAQDSCRADFTSFNGNSALSKIFTAQPWHSANMPVAEICWNFGDGHDTCIAATAGAVAPLTIVHNYAQPGNYTVCLKLKYMQGGCVAEKCKTVTVGATTQPDSCKADYFVQNGNQPGQRYFTPTPYHNNNKPVIEVKWDFGDGTPALITPGATSVVHFYPQAGTYNVCVRIKYDGGCIAEKCKPLTIANAVDSCIANFETSPIASTPLGRKFTALPGHSNNKKPREVCWTFGDGSDTCVQYDSTYTGLYFMYHTYQQQGNYNVCVKIKYFGGCIAEKCKPVQVGQSQADTCKADYIVQAGNITGQRYFTPTPWHNNNKPVIEVKWDFGDGTPVLITPGAVTVLHFYPQPGTYNVCVRIKYDGGCIAEKCKPVTIIYPADSCRADFETSAVTSAPLTRKFTALTWSNPPRKVQQVCWNFGNGMDTCINYDSTYTGGYFVYHTYATYSTYNVCVKIKYYGGCIAEKCRPVAVNQPAADSCLANFEALSTAGTVLTKTFVAQLWHSQNKRPEKICWTFGDGKDTCINYNPAQTYNYFVNHTYLQAGIYTVCVKIKYQGGCVSEKCKPVTVGIITQPDTCKADFSTTAYSSNLRLRKFTALPWHNNGKRPEKICWLFGDGRDTCINYNPANPNNEYSVLHQYANNGVYTVCVKIKYQGGCEAEKCKPVAVGLNTQPDSCRASFSQTQAQNTNPLLRRFNAIPWHIAQKRPEKICWTFGDGRDTCITYNAATPANYSVLHQYSAAGTYTVCVKIWYQGGCVAQQCNPVNIVIPPCRAQFTDSMISAFKVAFRGQALLTNPNDPVTSWSWTFGDGTAGSGQNVVHEYAQPGVYNVCLKIKTAAGCENTFCKPKVIDSSIRILHLMPNPVQNTLYIAYYSYHNETGQIKIYNIYGILVKSFSRQMTIGYNNFSTDVSTLTPGPYSLVVQTPTTLASSVFFKQ